MLINNKLRKLFKVIFLLSISTLSTLASAEDRQSDADLWERVASSMTLSYADNKRIAAERRWYLENPTYIKRVSARAEPYLYFVVEALDQRQMPIELALLPIMESAYDPFAYSHGRAAGLWQIIPGTAGDLGLDQNWWYDARRDVRASTHAALDYLEQLNKAFGGDWLKTLAAYNGGQRRVKNAEKYNRDRGRSTDFWSLKLPTETRNYVPRWLALTQIVSNAKSYGLSLTPIADLPHFVSVNTYGQLDLSQAAELSGLTIEDIYKLNPGFSRWATAPSGPHELLIPTHHEEKFVSSLDALDPSQRVQWNRYTIRSGDSLIRIARQFNTGVDVIKSINNLDGNTIRAGDILLIPTAIASADHYSLSQGQRLSSRQRKGSGHKVDYVVKSGDSFWDIARAHGVSVRQLAEWNGKAVRDPIFPGEKLVIWRQSASLDPGAVASLRPPVVKKLGYRVRQGDSLAGIAGKFNLSVEDIIGWNSGLADKKYIHPGDRLTLFVDVTGG